MNTLHTAARKGDLETVKAQLRGNPDLVFSKDAEYGYTAMHLAAMNGHEAMLKLLLACKADVNARNKDGATPLRAAAANGHKNAVELLVANKANVNARDKYGETPLHLAAAEGHSDVSEVLLANGAEVNACDNFGGTPLHLAARGKRNVAGPDHFNAVVELLLASGADVNAKDVANRTPLARAESNNHCLVIELLRQHASLRQPGGDSEANFEHWKATGEPEAWVQQHPEGWHHEDWLELLASLRQSQYWPMDETIIGQHLEMLGTARFDSVADGQVA